jgi:exodeoxyribonuclease VII large subunit
MAVHYRIVGPRIFVFGQTFPIKETLKALGARFHSGEKHWYLQASPENQERVHNICLEAGGGPLQLQSIETPPSQNLERLDANEVKTPLAQSPTTASARVAADFGITVRDLMQKASLAITGAFPSPLWIIGEVHNLADRATGTFFQLSEAKDERGTATIEVKATLWRSALQIIYSRRGEQTIKELMRDGFRVRVLAQVSMFGDRGQLSLNILDIDPDFTKGALALARERLITELRKANLFDANRRLGLVAFPFRVGLITADGSRAYGDFTDQLKEGRFPGQVVFAPAQMQGEKVSETVPAAISKLCAEQVDVIILTRGGGSAADLRWFDSREIAFAIAKCSVPIIAAIGHHDDQSIAEEIAFTRQKTPTAAAEFILEQFRKIDLRLHQLATQIQRRATENLDLWSSQHRWLEQNLMTQGQQFMHHNDRKLQGHEQKIQESVQRLLNALTLRLRGLGHQIQLSSERLCQRHSAAQQLLRSQFQHDVKQAVQGQQRLFDQLLQKLQQHDPKPWLQKGWTMLETKQGGIRNIKNLKEGDQVFARLEGGRAHLTVKEIELLKREENHDH